MDPVGILVAVVLHPLGEGYQPAPEPASIAAPLETTSADAEPEVEQTEEENAALVVETCAEWNSPGHGSWEPDADTPGVAEYIATMDAFCAAENLDPERIPDDPPPTDLAPDPQPPAPSPTQSPTEETTP